jgi:hypothetical protein
MDRSIRLDFIDHPSGTGYVAAVNGRRIDTPLSRLSEVLALARTLGTTARYSGIDPGRVSDEGGLFQGGDENFVR